MFIQEVIKAIPKDEFEVVIKIHPTHEDLKEVIEEGLREKKFSPVIRLEVEDNSENWISHYISSELELSGEDLF